MLEAIQQALENGKDLDTAIREVAAPMKKNLELLLKAEPFYPFVLHMRGGTTAQVRNPERTAVRDSVIALSAPDPQSPTGFREHTLLALIHIVSIEILVPDEPVVVAAS